MNLRKIAIAVNMITFPLAGLATDYTDVTGSISFNNGDTAQTISTNLTDVITVNTGRIEVQNNGSGPTYYRGIVDLNGGSVDLGTGSRIDATNIAGASQLSALAIGSSAVTTAFNAKNLNVIVNNNADVNTTQGIVIYEGNNTINLEGNTVIIVDSQSNTTNNAIVSGLSLNNSSGTTEVKTDDLMVLVGAENTGDNNIVQGISVASYGAGQNKLTYNNAFVEVTSKQANVGTHGIINTDGVIEGKNTTIEVTGGSKGTFDQDLYGLSVASINNTAKTDLTGDTVITLKSGDNDIWMTGISVLGNNAELNQQANLTINLDTNGYTDNRVYGIRASDANNTTKGNVNATLTNLTINSLGNADSDSAYIEATRGGVINITSDNLSLGANAINSGETALSANDDGKINLQSLSNTQVTGNLLADQGTIKFSGANGTLTGQAITSNNGNINVELNKMTWQMIGDSNINALNLSNSTVNFAGYANTGNFATLSVADLISNQGAVFKMNVDIANGQGDLLKITNSATGNYSLNIANRGNSLTNGTETIKVIEDNSTNQTAKFTSNTIELGGYQYGLAQSGKNWQLAATGGISNAANASANFLNANYLLTYIDTQTLLQRMGELRSTEGQEGNLWIRGFSGKLDSFASGKLHGFDMDYNGVQIGIDKLIPSKQGNFYIGTMVGYTDANPDYKYGSGGVRDINGGIYGTYIDNSGFYIDSIVKYTRIKNNFSITDTAGQHVKGKAKSDGYGLSLEAGKRFTISSTNFYLEPQVQLSYSHQGGDTVKVSNGLKVKLDSYDSLLGRGSLIAGYEIKQGDNPIDIYLKSGYVKEFKGNTAYYLNGNKEKHNFRGGWVDSAIGITAQFNKRHNLYAEVSYANGNRFDKQQANIGYRFQF